MFIECSTIWGKMLSLFLIEKSEISCFDIMTVMDMCVELLSKKNHIYL